MLSGRLPSDMLETALKPVGFFGNRAKRAMQKYVSQPMTLTLR
jgi:hypothetical protein